MKKVINTVRGLMSVVANFKKTEFEKQCAGIKKARDTHGVNVRYMW